MALVVKNLPPNAGYIRDAGWEDPQGRAWQATAVFLPGVSHGQRSLVGYSPWRLKELDTPEVTLHVCAFCVWVKVGLKVDIYRGS